MDFTEEQQAHIDSLIKKKYAEAKAAEIIAAAEAKHAGEIHTLRAELEKIKGREGESNERVRRALLKVEIAQTNAINVDTVLKLTSDYVKTGEDGDLKVTDDSGNLHLDEAGRPVSVKSFLEGFLKDNPYLAKASGHAGAGSFGARNDMGAAKTMRRTEFNNLTASQQNNYIQSGGRLKD